MCGRFAFYSPAEAVTQLFGVDTATQVLPRYNLAPTQFVPAIRQSDRARRLSLLYWGLVPFWAKDRKIGNRMINARAETLRDKPSFRTAFKRRRCLVLADGYYEWQKTADGKLPHYIHACDGKPFAMAGLWESWQPKTAAAAPPAQSGALTGETGNSSAVAADAKAEAAGSSQPAPLESCTIITTEASASMQSLHHRMPVILSADSYATWLDPDNDDTAALQSLLAPAPDDLLQAFAVSKRVNSPANEGPELLDPVA